VGIYWNKDAKTEGEETRRVAKPKPVPRPRPEPPVSGTRAWTSTLAVGDDKNEPDRHDEPARNPLAHPRDPRDRGPGKR
jgi:hypothetical protein